MPRSAAAGLLVLVAAALTLSGCGSAGDGRTPSGTTASKRIDTTGVTRLDVAYGLDVRVDGRTLRIQLTPDAAIANRPTLPADVTVSRLEELRAAGASTITVASKIPNSNLRLLVSGNSRVAADLALDRADATVSGTSRLVLTGRANALKVEGSGSSTLELADLHLQALEISLSGASHGSVQVDRTIAAQVSGASKLTYKGTPQFTKRDTSGASSIQPA